MGRERPIRHPTTMSGDEDAFTRPRHYLSISGGGASGAFGAGLLKSWSESGTRPEMWIVTGISTGALIAPHQFRTTLYMRGSVNPPMTLKRRVCTSLVDILTVGNWPTSL